MQEPHAPDWAQAPAGFDWRAQDADGQWFWYSQQPECGWAGGIWRAHSRRQQPAGQGAPNADWADTLSRRPGVGKE